MASTATVTVTGSTFDGNSGLNGGAIAVSATILIDSCHISQSYAGDQGGAIYAESADVTLTSTVITECVAGNKGGGLFSTTATFAISDSEFSSNTAREGSALYAEATPAPPPTLSLANTLVRGNTALVHGSSAVVLISANTNVAVSGSTAICGNYGSGCNPNIAC